MVDTIKLNYKRIRDLELVAYYELPENRRNTELVLGYEKEFFYDSVDKIELALMSPKRMAELEALNSLEIMEIFIQWVMLSKLQHDVKWNQQRKKDRSMSSLFSRFKKWLGISKPEPVKQERDSTGRFIDPKEGPVVLPVVESEKTEPKVAPAPATATAKKPRAKTPAKPRAPKVVAFDPNAKDGDGDGIVQDGTIHARPATPKKSAPKKKGTN
jgi:hypothetical protein